MTEYGTEGYCKMSFLKSRDLTLLVTVVVVSCSKRACPGLIAYGFELLNLDILVVEDMLMMHSPSSQRSSPLNICK